MAAHGLECEEAGVKEKIGFHLKRGNAKAFINTRLLMKNQRIPTFMQTTPSPTPAEILNFMPFSLRIKVAQYTNPKKSKIQIVTDYRKIPTLKCFTAFNPCHIGINN